MRFIKKKNLERDLENVPSGISKTALTWLSVVESRETVWRNFVDVRRTYKSDSQVGKLYVFNIKDFRLIVGINFKRQVVYYKAILSHAEYDKGLWKNKFGRAK